MGSDFKLLHIANAFQSVLQIPWEGYKPLRGVLEACHEGKYGRRTERLFHEHSQDGGVVALGLVAKHENKLIEEIDDLSEAETIKLAKLVKCIPKKAIILEYIDGFVPSKKTSVRDPPPTFSRPRVRSKLKRHLDATTTKDSRSSSPQPASETEQHIRQETKRRRSSQPAEKETPLGGDSDLLSAHEVGFSLAHQPLPCPPPAKKTPANNQSYTRDLAAQTSSLCTSKRSDTNQQPPSHQQGHWSATGEQSAQLIDEAWDITKSFMEGEPLEAPQQLQMTDQGEPWNSSRGQVVQLQMMDDKWAFDESFLRGRPLEFGSQEIQITGQGGQFTQPQMIDDKWDFAEAFLEGRPLEFP